MADLEESGITPEESEEVLRDFRRQLVEGGWEVGTPFEELLQKGLGPEGSARVLERMRRQRTPLHPFAALEKLSPEELLRTLRPEHPQITAFVLANIESALAGEVLSDSRTSSAATSSCVSRGSRGRRSERRRRHRDAQPPWRLRRRSLPARDEAAPARGRRDPERHRRRRGPRAHGAHGRGGRGDHRGHPRDDVHLRGPRKARLPRTPEGPLLHRRPPAGHGAEGAEGGLQDQILGNVSKRVRDSVVEEKDFLGPLPVNEVTEARREITRVARGLIEGGEITLPRGKVEQLVD
jgi:flagellar motor switch protein FliG